jgi:hypothetical protein
VPVTIRFADMTPAILEHDADVPPRVHVVLNGRPVALTSFTTQVALPGLGLGPVGARGVLSGNLAHVSGLNAQPRVATSQRRAATGGRGLRNAGAALGKGAPAAPAGGTQAPGFVLSGVLPVSLLRPGPNSLLVEVILGAQRRLHASVGFVATPAPKPDAPADPGKGPGPALPSLTIPRAGLPTRALLHHPLAAERARVAGALARAVHVAPSDPRARVARLSPALARRVNVEPPPEALLRRRPSRLALSVPREPRP